MESEKCSLLDVSLSVKNEVVLKFVASSLLIN